MQIGITGATGTVLTHRLEKQSYCCFRGDICSKDDIGVWINENEFSTIIHLAAMVPTHKVKYNPNQTYQINVGGTKNLLEILQIYKKNPCLFYTSTSHIYKSKNSPIEENDSINPISLCMLKLNMNMKQKK